MKWNELFVKKQQNLRNDITVVILTTTCTPTYTRGRTDMDVDRYTDTYIHRTHPFSSFLLNTFDSEKVEGQEGSVLIENLSHGRNEKIDSIHKPLPKSSSICGSFLWVIIGCYVVPKLIYKAITMMSHIKVIWESWADNGPLQDDERGFPLLFVSLESGVCF